MASATDEGDEDQVRQDLRSVNDLLARLVTLSAALTAGAVLLLVDYTLGHIFRIAAVLCLVAFGCALKGVLPTAAVLPPSQALRNKTTWLHRSAGSLLCALIIAVAGMLMR